MPAKKLIFTPNETEKALAVDGERNYIPLFMR